MQGRLSLLKRWLPALVWMMVIFSASSDAMSANRSSRIIRPLLLWLKPDLSNDAVFRIVFIVRKSAHIMEYAVLGVLCWLGCQRPATDGRRRWSWKTAGIALALAVAYALTDEFHQSLVPSRQGQFADVALDSFGAFLGLAVVWIVRRRSHRSR